MEQKGPTKKEIRKQILTLRDEMSEEERHTKSQKITQLLISHDWFKQAKSILIFVNFLSEVETTSIIKYAWKLGKRVYCPRIIEDEMFFFRLHSFSELETGYKGILEPQKEAPKFDENEELSKALMVMPGVAFDKCGHRIGYGKGYYDRYLSKAMGMKTIAIAFEEQVLSEIPFDLLDVIPNILVTQRGVTYMTDLVTMGEKASKVKYVIQNLSEEKKNKALLEIARQLVSQADKIQKANACDIKKGQENNMNPGLIDRLKLDEKRIKAMAEGIEQIATLPDPIGEVMDEFMPANGLKIKKVRVPLGVIGIIYESRPNVTADAFGLCFKSGNAVILKGGSDALLSNIAITEVIREALKKENIDPDVIQLIESTDRSVTTQFMRMNQYVDVLIPRGSAGLIRAVVENSTVPVIETGTGNCHIYVDESADLAMAVKIIVNAKTQRISVCNACESLVLHENIREKFLPLLEKALKEYHVEMRGDLGVLEILPDCKEATDEDYGKEYLDYIISMKTVSSIDEAIEHINKYNTKHSEAIMTNNQENAEKFQKQVDAACVYVNTSTRFTDGFEFGFGAEIGISTQKLHARGPMGLKELTSYKYIINGTGQVRP